MEETLLLGRVEEKPRTKVRLLAKSAMTETQRKLMICSTKLYLDDNRVKVVVVKYIEAERMMFGGKDTLCRWIWCHFSFWLSQFNMPKRGFQELE